MGAVDKADGGTATSALAPKVLHVCIGADAATRGPGQAPLRRARLPEKTEAASIAELRVRAIHERLKEWQPNGKLQAVRPRRTNPAWFKRKEPLQPLTNLFDDPQARQGE